MKGQNTASASKCFAWKEKKEFYSEMIKTYDVNGKNVFSRPRNNDKF